MKNKKNTEKNKLSGAVSAIVAQEAVKNNKTAITTTINVGFILLGLTVVSIAGYSFYAFYWKNRFKRWNYDPKSPASNVSPVSAKAKADALYTAMKGAGTDEKTIFETLAGVNKNGFIAVYNAFGKREPGGISISLGNRNYEDLVSFLHGDLSKTELERLRRVLGPAGTLF